MTLLAPTGLLLQNPPAAQTPLQGRGGTLCTSADIICLGCLFPCPLNSVLPDSWGPGVSHNPPFNLFLRLCLSPSLVLCADTG